jgi:hypothetical protein
MDEQTRQSIPRTPKPQQPLITAQPTYPAIRTLAGIYRVIAWLFLIAGVIFCVVVTAGSSSLPVFIGSALFGAVGFLVQFASAELVAIRPPPALPGNIYDSRALENDFNGQARTLLKPAELFSLWFSIDQFLSSFAT